MKNNMKTINNYNFLAFTFIFLVISTLYTFPMFLKYIIFFSLIFFNTVNRIHIRIILSFFLIITLSITASSRKYGFVSDDLNSYYYAYIDIMNYGLSFDMEYFRSTEVLLPTFYYILSFSAIKSPVFLMFAESLFLYFLFYFWLELLIKKYNLQNPNFLIVISFLLISIYYPTQLTRQFLSVLILMYIFVIDGIFFKVLLSILSLLTHTTALLYIGIYIFTIFKKNSIKIVLSVIFLLIAYYIANEIIFKAYPLEGYINYYLKNSLHSFPINERSLIIIFLFIASFIFKGHTVYKNIKYNIMFLIVLYLILSKYGLIAERIFLPLLSIGLGTLMYLVLYHKPKYIMIISLMLMINHFLIELKVSGILWDTFFIYGQPFYYFN